MSAAITLVEIDVTIIVRMGNTSSTTQQPIKNKQM